MKNIIIIQLYVLGLLLTGCATNPITGDNELMLLGESSDVEMGKQYAPQIEKELGGRIEDPVLQRYVDRVGQNVAKVSQKAYFYYSFVALNHDSVNAFALPGGYIFITRGLLEKLDSESQLAAVLAHETAHVVARDVVNAMSKQIGLTAILAAMAYSGAPGEVLRAADMAQQIIGLKFSREDEYDADIGGLDYLVRAGYDPYGMVETMQTLERLQESRPPEFFSTHPSPENRVGYISQRIQQKYHTATNLKKGQQEYRDLVLERLKAPKKGNYEILLALLK